ncbi:MAG TPA: hypothetical protein VH442_20325 [Micromonosporaceae bacterium]|jgi:hypothetical protein
MTLSPRRGAVWVAAAALAMAPVWLLAAAAHASDPVVTFNGQPDVTPTTVSCPSAPDVQQLTVAPGTTVDFVNHLGVAATLSSDDSHQSLDDGDMVPVTFNIRPKSTGRVNVVLEMVPDCTLDVGTHTSITVTVSAPTPTGSAAPSAAPTVRPTTPAGGPAPTASASGKPARSHADHTSGTKHRALPSPSRSRVPAGSGNGADEDSLSQSASVDAGYVTFGDPVDANGSNRGASGLLTLVATVSVGGVTAAAIRAIIAQRPTMTRG